MFTSSEFKVSIIGPGHANLHSQIPHMHASKDSLAEPYLVGSIIEQQQLESNKRASEQAA